MAVVKRRPLSRRRILEAAVRFVDREGLRRLSVCGSLGVSLGSRRCRSTTTFEQGRFA